MSRDQILTRAVARAGSPSMAEIDMLSIEPFASTLAGPVETKQQDKILEIVAEDL